MRVALISPYSDIHAIGLRGISAYIKKHGFSTRLIFLPTQSSLYSREHFCPYPQAIIHEVADLVKGDDLIGISLMSNYYESVRDLTIGLKERLPTMPVVWGGIHPTVMPEESIGHADYVCVGEAERSFLNLCRNLSRGEAVANVSGVWSKDGDEIHSNACTDVITDLNELPPLDHDLDENYVLDGPRGLVKLTEENLVYYLGTAYWTMYTRGCPFSCSYCCNDAFRSVNRHMTRLRQRSPESMIRELAAIGERFPFVEYVYFADDTLFALSEEKVREFCETYRRHIGLPFIVPGLQPSVFTERKLEMLLDAGMIRTRVGIQSGSENGRKVFNRKQDNETIVRISRALRRHRRRLVAPNYDMILDNPWETTEDVAESIRLVSTLARPFSLHLFSLGFFPGTSLYKRAVEEGIIGAGETYREILHYSPNYLNLILGVLAVMRIPGWLLRILTGNRLIHTRREFPLVHRVLYNLILYRKAMHCIAKRDYSVFPIKWQIRLNRVLPAARKYGSGGRREIG